MMFWDDDLSDGEYAANQHKIDGNTEICLLGTDN